MAVSKKNPFDAIAKPKAESKAKTTKIAAAVTPEVQANVDAYIRLKAEITAREAEQANYAAAIIDHVRPQQDRLAFSGQYNKSFDVAGTTGNVVYTTTDRFSVPKGETEQEALSELLGEKFDQFFVSRRTITLKPAAAENPELIGKLMKAIEAAGLEVGDVFEVTDALAATQDLDRRQYELTPEQLEQFRILCKQYKPSLK